MTTTDTTLPRLVLAVLDGADNAAPGALRDYLLEQGGREDVSGIVRGVPAFDDLLWLVVDRCTNQSFPHQAVAQVKMEQRLFLARELPATLEQHLREVCEAQLQETAR